MCDSLIGTLLNIQGKTNDSVNARLDMVAMRIRHKLAPEPRGDATYLPPSVPYFVKTREKMFLRVSSWN